MNAAFTPQEYCLTAMIDDLRTMLSNFAHKYRLELEDCEQEAVLIILENWTYIERANGSMAYVCVVVRDELLRRMCQTWALSLDAPITAESNITYADTLAAPDERVQRNEKTAKVVHAALRQCSLEEQRFARDEYGLEEFQPMVTNWRDKPKHHYHYIEYASRKDHLKDAISCALKLDRQVQALIQRETCVL